MIPQIFISASAAIALLAGTLHLHGTFFGPDLRPQDPELEARMKEVPVNVSSQTTMWKAWIGFNAILSLGLMLFGLLYGYLAAFQFAVLRQSPFLLALGIVFLSGLVVIWKRYTYYLPAIVFAVALVLFAVGVAKAVTFDSSFERRRFAARHNAGVSSAILVVIIRARSGLDVSPSIDHRDETSHGPRRLGDRTGKESAVALAMALLLDAPGYALSAVKAACSVAVAAARRGPSQPCPPSRSRSALMRIAVDR